MQQTDWIFAFASVIGNSHISENIPCQDACRVGVFDKFTVSVVTDGAGSCKNSHLGSNQVSDFCIYHAEKLITRQGWVTEFPNQEVWHDTAKQILITVRKDLENYSIEHDIDFKSLACTVIMAISLPDGLLITHIGDGRAGYCTQEGQWLPMITPFHGEVANETVFITSDIWNDDLVDLYIESNVISGQVSAFCLLSDGCEKAAFEVNLYNSDKSIYYDPNRPFPAFFNPNRTGLTKLHEQLKSQDDINNLWAEFLTAGTEKLRLETDDKTMVLGVKIIQAI
ncbi:PP2C family serine/threonine-protein phosphatase [Larkinella rosea]|uniref:Protein phosphatase 2C domain-containing protein n=1 Tax=Larkinella rosea TaxID=2025312 RepID=A0A3P1BLS3_9BACT|nr:PP2C family serine/threonine-protein phosphatase [Larkinella rosea]RRB02050.1 protein phosphatase 2C domain-containing protein [Larkinella rosea]